MTIITGRIGLANMDIKKVMSILDEAQSQGAAIEVSLDQFKDYKLYKKENSISKKIKYGISLVQSLIDISNLDNAEKILGELRKIADEEKYMGAIWEKYGWIADSRKRWAEEIKYFNKAKDIYIRIPESIAFEGRTEDRILTADHFIARALYFRGIKSDLKESEKLFKENLDGYKKLEANDAIAFNYSWLARVYIAMKDFERAENATKKAEKYFSRAAKTKGEKMKSYLYRIRAELYLSEEKKEEALKSSLESLRYALPNGVYYNGIIEAVKEIVKAAS